MHTYKSGFKVSIPLIYSPGSFFNGHLSISTNIEYASITIIKTEAIQKQEITLRWNKCKEDPRILRSFNIYHALLVERGYLQPSGCSFQIRWEINSALSFLPGPYEDLSLDLLSLYSLLHVFGLTHIANENIYALLSHMDSAKISFAVCALMGGGIWYAGHELHDRLFLPAGLSVCFLEKLVTPEIIRTNESNVALMTSFITNLNRSNIDRCVEIGQLLCGINNQNGNNGLLLLTPLHDVPLIGALFINNNQAARFIRRQNPDDSSVIITSISNHGLKKH